MRVSALLNTICAVALVSLAACGKRPVTGPGPMIPPECEILQGPVESVDSITVALLGAARPEHAPWARNAGEQLLFGHLYETLITVDCLGGVRPGLAETWSSGDGGRRWTFELRRDARFWDGTHVAARDAAGSWQCAAVEPMTRGAGIDSAAAAGDRVLHVYLEQPHREVPRALSAPAFAVVKPSGESHWPLGSGPYRVVTPENRSAVMSRRTITAHPVLNEDGPIIRFIETSMYDARDLLEDVIDLMVTADPAVIEYAESRPQFATIALPWDRTYTLLSTSRFKEFLWGGTPGPISSDLPDGLARHAVRVDARGHRPPSWWDDLYGCGDLSTDVPLIPPVPPGAYPSSGLRRILYDSDDRIARDLAERIAALAAADPAASPEAAAITSAVPGLTGGTHVIIAEGVTSSELHSSLRDGDDFAYIIPIPRRPPDPCREARNLINRAQWLSTLEADFSKALIPLVDTRLHVIVKSGKVGLVVDWYGNILIENEMLQGR